MKLKNIFLGISLVALAATDGISQQAAQFGQFQYNMLDINPGYAGYRETFNLTLINRNQWVGFEGAPVTQTLTFNSPIKGKNFAYGATLSNDVIGPTQAVTFSVDGAYKILLSKGRERPMLSLGLKGSLRHYQADLPGVQIIDPGDESFLRSQSGVINPNVSFGAFLSGKTYFVGASAIGLVKNPLVNRGNELFDQMEGREQTTYYLTGGKIWKLNRQISIYPAILVKATRNAPVSTGAFFNFLIMSDFKVGGYYNFKEVAGALVQWQINRKLRLGYTFEVAVNSLITTNLGSHEFMLNYSFRKGRTAIIYPKYF